jgi:hypothetical protein
MTTTTRQNVIRILRALANVPQCDEAILLETVALITGGTVPAGDLKLALATAEAEGLALGITGALGVRKWILTDLGKATLAQL